MAPTLVVRKATTVDYFTKRSHAIHIITGGSDADQKKDGDWQDQDNRYRPTDEYLEILC